MTEAAIISPLFLVLIFGVIEMGLLFRDKLTLSSSVRDAARTAAAAGDDSNADYRILQTLKQSSSVVAAGNVTRVVVYNAASASDKPPAACVAGTAIAGVCNVYSAADLDSDASVFTCAASDRDRFWCPTGQVLGQPQRDTRLATLGFVGVYVEIQHRYVTGFFGRTVTMKESVAVRFEPRTS